MTPQDLKGKGRKTAIRILCLLASDPLDYFRIPQQRQLPPDVTFPLHISPEFLFFHHLSLYVCVHGSLGAVVYMWRYDDNFAESVSSLLLPLQGVSGIELRSSGLHTRLVLTSASRLNAGSLVGQLLQGRQSQRTFTEKLATGFKEEEAGKALLSHVVWLRSFTCVTAALKSALLPPFDARKKSYEQRAGDHAWYTEGTSDRKVRIVTY